mmetsp:Transcript_8713/g.20313  ORF Transcript_8713/g.20313 Transcript_8713/m.20313 type:complete len:258 (+) Transcript_8713:92-865(+)
MYHSMVCTLPFYRFTQHSVSIKRHFPHFYIYDCLQAAARPPISCLALIRSSALIFSCLRLRRRALCSLRSSRSALERSIFSLISDDRLPRLSSCAGAVAFSSFPLMAADNISAVALPRWKATDPTATVASASVYSTAPPTDRAPPRWPPHAITDLMLWVPNVENERRVCVSMLAKLPSSLSVSSSPSESSSRLADLVLSESAVALVSSSSMALYFSLKTSSSNRLLLLGLIVIWMPFIVYISHEGESSPPRQLTNEA